MESDPDIEWIEDAFRMSSPKSGHKRMKEFDSVPWSIELIGAKTSWAKSGDGTGTVDMDVFVIDTGVSSSDINVVENIDFSGSDASAADSDGHGTHIAGVIGAFDDDRGIVGIAPGARIHNLKVFGPDGSADDGTVIQALEHVLLWKAANPGSPAVVNLSLGEDVGTSSFTALDDAVQKVINSGITVVVAAGNEGADVSGISPAHVPGALTVGSVDDKRKFSWFSNFGLGIDILAPGQNVISTSPDNFGVDVMTGTSMSAAHVSGAAALVLAMRTSASPREVGTEIQTMSTSRSRSVPNGTTKDMVSVSAN